MINLTQVPRALKATVVVVTAAVSQATRVTREALLASRVTLQKNSLIKNNNRLKRRLRSNFSVVKKPKSSCSNKYSREANKSTYEAAQRDRQMKYYALLGAFQKAHI